MALAQSLQALLMMMMPSRPLHKIIAEEVHLRLAKTLVLTVRQLVCNKASGNILTCNTKELRAMAVDADGCRCMWHCSGSLNPAIVSS